MLLSLALIFLFGMGLGKLFEKMKLPGLLGMIIAGIIIGPYGFSLLDNTVLSISADLRKIALIIILTRAGLNLNIEDLIKAGRPAILMCFVPALFEIAGMVLIAPLFFDITLLEAAIMGAVVAAVSPAVVVPRMLKLMAEGYGEDKSIPQIIMAGASVDDVFVIVLFTSFTNLAQGGAVSLTRLLAIPTSIASGLAVGVLIGIIMSYFFEKVHIRDSGKVIIMLSISFILVTVESYFKGAIGFSGLLAIMATGATLKHRKYEASIGLSSKFSKLWVGAEIILFVLVGATVNIGYALNAGLITIIIVLSALCFRVIGVFVCMVKTRLNKKERIFCAFAYMPKATVQAAIGGIPLSMGLACGDIVLTVAVLSILITAPLGAAIVDKTYKNLLCKN